MRNQKKYAPCLPLNWVGWEYLKSPWMGQVESLSLFRSCALTLNKCALVVATCVTAAKDWWKICVISLVTRLCLSTPKSTTGCIPPGIHKVTDSPEPVKSPQSSLSNHKRCIMRNWVDLPPHILLQTLIPCWLMGPSIFRSNHLRGRFYPLFT